MKRTLGVLCMVATLATATAGFARAADDVSFAGKTINMIVGFDAGGGVDLYARILGRHLSEYLPGKPNIIVLNQPGAGGMVAMNSWVAKSETDGLSAIVGAQSQIDPEAVFRTKAKFEPVKLQYIGGIAGPSQPLFVRNDALKRLTDKSQPPVVMGIVGTTLRTGYYQALWGVKFLGWNVKWVPGYQQTAQVRQAMERGELDMSAFGQSRDIQYLQDSGKFTIVSQSGMMEDGKRATRPMVGKVPIMYDLVQGKISDPAAREAFDYSENVLQIGKWLALPPGTPDPIVAAYVKAYEAVVKDPKFQAEVEKTDPDSPVVKRGELLTLVRDLAKVSPKTLDYITGEMKRQGL